MPWTELARVFDHKTHHVWQEASTAARNLVRLSLVVEEATKLGGHGAPRRPSCGLSLGPLRRNGLVGAHRQDLGDPSWEMPSLSHEQRSLHRFISADVQ